MAVNKNKRTRAVNALTKAGMDAALARATVSGLDLDKPFGPQIAALAEDVPELFEPAPDADPADEDDTEDQPKTAREKIAARLTGRGATDLVERLTYRRPADAERPSTASKAAREAAAHLVKHTTKNTPPARKWYSDEPKSLNTGPRLVRERPASADQLAARLRR
ncbi:hypothetical protein ACH4MG_34895 [Streptomyces sp. NPDC017454]|uniref:hypothetical protein n=1 Tax=Streptomyces sp. NPDC017454 TaxID=3364997 RepID=UPI0037A04B46